MTPAEQFAGMIAGLQRCGLSLPEIAEQSGLARTTVWRGATGQMRKPTYESFVQLKGLVDKVGPPPSGMVRR